MSIWCWPNDASRHHPEFTGWCLKASSGSKGFNCLIVPSIYVFLHIVSYFLCVYSPNMVQISNKLMQIKVYCFTENKIKLLFTKIRPKTTLILFCYDRIFRTTCLWTTYTYIYLESEYNYIQIQHHSIYLCKALSVQRKPSPLRDICVIGYPKNVCRTYTNVLISHISALNCHATIPIMLWV